MAEAPPIPRTVIDVKPRCACGRVLFAYAARPWLVRCKRCGAVCPSDGPHPFQPGQVPPPP